MPKWQGRAVRELPQPTFVHNLAIRLPTLAAWWGHPDPPMRSETDDKSAFPPEDLNLHVAAKQRPEPPRPNERMRLAMAGLQLSLSLLRWIDVRPEHLWPWH